MQSKNEIKLKKNIQYSKNKQHFSKRAAKHDLKNYVSYHLFLLCPYLQFHVSHYTK